MHKYNTNKFFKDKRIVIIYVVVILLIIIGIAFALSESSYAFNTDTGVYGIDETAYGETHFDSANLDLKPILDSDITTKTDNVIKIGKKEIKLGEDQYINRLIQYIDLKSDSKTYSSIVGAELSDIGNKIDALNNAACKGTHNKVTKFEAERYLIYTYLFLGDLLSLENEE